MTFLKTSQVIDDRYREQDRNVARPDCTTKGFEEVRRRSRKHYGPASHFGSRQSWPKREETHEPQQADGSDVDEVPDPLSPSQRKVTERDKEHRCERRIRERESRSSKMHGVQPVAEVGGTHQIHVEVELPPLREDRCSQHS